jgi:hypothetical protein
MAVRLNSAVTNARDRSVRIFGRPWRVTTYTDELPHPTVRSVVEDVYGRIWLATYGGAARLESGRFVPVTDKKGPGSRTLRNIAKDSLDRLWFGSVGSGLWRWDGGRDWTRISPPLIDVNCYAVSEQRPGRYWFGCCTRVVCWEEAHNRVVVELSMDSGGLPARFTYLIRQDRQGDLWLAQAGPLGGLVRLSCQGGDRVRWTEVWTRVDGLGSRYIYVAIPDHRGNVWVGTNGGGVSCFDGERFTAFGPEQGLAGDCVNYVYVAADGLLWFACGNQNAYGREPIGGVSVFDGTRFQSFSVGDGLTGTIVYWIEQSSDGDIWLATDRGLTRLTPEQAGRRRTMGKHDR